MPDEKTTPQIIEGWYYTPLALPQFGHFLASAYTSARALEEASAYVSSFSGTPSAGPVASLPIRRR
jgi:hypothetical protein